MQIYCHLYSALFQILCFIYISREKNPESQENIFLMIPVLSNYAEDLESHVQGDILRKFMWLVWIQ